MEESNCPMTGKACNGNCAWFHQGECVVMSLPYLVDKLDNMENIENVLRKLVNVVDSISGSY